MWSSRTQWILDPVTGVSEESAEDKKTTLVFLHVYFKRRVSIHLWRPYYLRAGSATFNGVSFSKELLERFRDICSRLGGPVVDDGWGEKFDRRDTESFSPPSLDSGFPTLETPGRPSCS